METRALHRQTLISPEQRRSEEDATRLYDQGWSIFQVAKRFEHSHEIMRRTLARHVTLRPLDAGES
jgi:hypothetical protein